MSEDIPAHPYPLSVINVKLREGESPQRLLDGLVEASAQNSCAWNYLHDGIALLARHGARVASAQPGCPFERLIEIHHKETPDLLFDIAYRLAGKEGEFPFHLLARDYYIDLSKGMFENKDIQASLHSVDDTGRTVSHYLWDPKGTAAKTVEASRQYEAQGNDEMQELLAKAWIVALRRIWTTQEILDQLGVGMEIPDHQGRTALDLCVERLEAEDALLFPGKEICTRVKAYQDKLQLEARSPEPIKGKASPRL